MARTRNAGKQAVVFDEEEQEGGGVVTIHGSLAQTWSPGAVSSVPDPERSPAGGAGGTGADSSLLPDQAQEPERDPDEEKAVAQSRAERIARRAAALRAIEERDNAHSEDRQRGGFGRTFGGDYSDEKPGQNDPARADVKTQAAHGDKISKLDHRSVLGNRDSTVDGLLDFGMQRKKPPVDARDGLDLDAGSMKRRGLVQSPRNQKINRALRQAEHSVSKPQIDAEDEGVAPQAGAAAEVQDAKTHVDIASEFVDKPEEERGGELDFGDEDGPLGALLNGMAKNLSTFGDRKELERELRALKEALAGEEGDASDREDDNEVGERAVVGARHDEGPHRSPVGKTRTIARARGDEQATSQRVVRDDISSSDDESSSDFARSRGPMGGRRPHVYQAAGLHQQAPPRAAGRRPVLPGEQARERQRGSGSDDERDMRPVTPPPAPATAGTDASLANVNDGAANFVGSKTWSPGGRVPDAAGAGADSGAEVDRCDSCLCLRLYLHESALPHPHFLALLLFCGIDDG